MTTQDYLDDITTDIGEALRETWLKGYNTASQETLTNALGELERRVEGMTTNGGHHEVITGLNIAIAIIKDMLK